MSAPFPYQYVVLRAVPRIEREEFVNVGVALFSEAAGVLEILWRLDEPRLRALHPGLDLEGLRQALAQLAEVCSRDEARLAGTDPPQKRRPGARFGWIAAPRSTVLQPGPVHGGITRDPHAQARRLLDLLVG